MNKEENTLPVPNTVIEELRGAELIAWIIAEKFYIFSHKLDERNYLPLSTTIEEWFESFNFTQRGHKEILDAFKSLKEKGFIENNELRCHEKDGKKITDKWNNFDGNDQYFFGTGNSEYAKGIESVGYFTPVNNEVTFSSKLSLKDKVVLTTLLYRWRYAKKFETYLCVLKEIENTFGLKKVNDVMEKLKKNNIVKYECNRGGWRELISFELNTSALDIKTRSTETKRHYNKSGKPRKPYTRKTNKEEVKIDEGEFMNIDYKKMLEEMNKQEADSLLFECDYLFNENNKEEMPEIKEEEIIVEEVEPVEETEPLEKDQAAMITGCRGMCKELKNKLLQELATLPSCFRDIINIHTLFKKVYNNLTEEQKEMGRCYFNHEKYTGPISTNTKRPNIKKEEREMPSLYDMFNEAETLQDDYEEVKREYIDYINENEEFVYYNDCSNRDHSFDDNEDPESIKPGYYKKGTARAAVVAKDNEPKELTAEDFCFVDEVKEEPVKVKSTYWQDNEEDMDELSTAYGF